MAKWDIKYEITNSTEEVDVLINASTDSDGANTVEIFSDSVPSSGMALIDKKDATAKKKFVSVTVDGEAPCEVSTDGNKHAHKVVVEHGSSSTSVTLRDKSGTLIGYTAC
ncbi:MAG: hypothetical protein HKN91_12875 [Acidimicrobiia bacterium]|nr:hypothetical protein [Acidimicrobiia bacterium]